MKTHENVRIEARERDGGGGGDRLCEIESVMEEREGEEGGKRDRKAELEFLKRPF